MTTFISNTQPIRRQMHEWLDTETDDNLVSEVAEFKEQLYADKYLKKITDKEYRESIERAIAQANAGQTISQEDLEKEIEKW
jgi:hypothetical protein